MSRLTILKNLVTSKAGRQILTARKYSPQVLFAAGVVGVIGAAVLASRATLKLDSVLDEHDETLSAHEDDLLDDKIPYSRNEYKKDVRKTYVRTVYNIAKLYAPAAGVGTLAIAALTGSHVILTNRNVALTAAAASLQKGFDAYRARVVAELGKDKDREFRFGTIEREIVEETAEGPVVKTIKELDPNGMSIYARVFDQNSRNWDRYPEHNLIFLKAQQDYLNNLLHARGHVLLNDVYDALDIPRSKAGAVVGWALSKDGDNFVDFGLFRDAETSRRFIDGYEASIWLDFNVQGVVYDLIGTNTDDCE